MCVCVVRVCVCVRACACVRVCALYVRPDGVHETLLNFYQIEMAEEIAHQVCFCNVYVYMWYLCVCAQGLML